jgi:hypothetical protein
MGLLCFFIPICVWIECKNAAYFFLVSSVEGDYIYSNLTEGISYISSIYTGTHSMWSDFISQMFILRSTFHLVITHPLISGNALRLCPFDNGGRYAFDVISRRNILEASHFVRRKKKYGSEAFPCARDILLLPDCRWSTHPNAYRKANQVDRAKGLRNHTKPSTRNLPWLSIRNKEADSTRCQMVAMSKLESHDIPRYSVGFSMAKRYHSASCQRMFLSPVR